MSRSGIQFFNRYTGQVEMEKVYGESWLRFVLFNPFGQLALHAVVKRVWFSRWYGGKMSQSGSVSWVRPFIEQYGIAEEEHVKATNEFTSFNDFFYRKLKHVFFNAIFYFLISYFYTAYLIISIPEPPAPPVPCTLL